MKPLSIALLFAGLLVTGSALAHDHDHGSTEAGVSVGGDLKWPAHWAPRHESSEATLAITTRNGGVTLLINHDVLAAELSDAKMHEIDRRIREESREADDSDLGHAIRSVVLHTVRNFLRHSAECDLADVRDVDYRDGELVITATSGRHVFERIDVEDDDFGRAFRERDARAFVAEFHRLKSGGR